jgi:cytoplasmic iron level regulating protein YaaA (DUF328/UPF0246 family)
VIDRKRDVRRSEPPYSEREFGASQSDYEPKEQQMSDIVERITHFGLSSHREWATAYDLLDKAQAEIKRLRAGRAAVVEECAKVADEAANLEREEFLNSSAETTADNIAQAIRALKGGGR